MFWSPNKSNCCVPFLCISYRITLVMLYRVWFERDTDGCWLRWSINPRQHCAVFAVLWIPIPLLVPARSQVQTLCSSTCTDVRSLDRISFTALSRQGITKRVKLFAESERWCQVLFKMYLKGLVTFQICHSTSAAQSLFLRKRAASVLHMCILCAPDRVRSVLTFPTTNAAGTLRVCRVCVLQLQPENHPSIQNSSREMIFLFN